jgi:hypothetical protein
MSAVAITPTVWQSRAGDSPHRLAACYRQAAGLNLTSGGLYGTPSSPEPGKASSPAPGRSRTLRPQARPLPGLNRIRRLS